MNDERLREVVAQLAATVNVRGVRTLQRLRGGRNNRCYRVDTATRPLFLKVYPPRDVDPRPRLASEYAFVRFAWVAGIRSVPEPVAADDKIGIALYSFVEGRAPAAQEIDHEHVEQALGLIEDLNRWRQTPRATELPLASEACFSFSEHVRRVGERVAALTAISGEESIDRETRDFVNDRLMTTWAEVKADAVQEAEAGGFAEEPPLPARQRCLSPSDFGFHNALVRPSGELVFHDFEYAGWDDPAKLIVDFFRQPELPVPARYRDTFEQRVLRCVALPAIHAARSAALDKVLGVKWACIALNDFLADGESRRRFADPEGDVTERKATQLQQARNLLDKLEVSTRSDEPSPLPSEGRGPGG